MLKRLLQASINVLTCLAYANVAAATTIVSYQPELPEELM